MHAVGNTQVVALLAHQEFAEHHDVIGRCPQVGLIAKAIAAMRLANVFAPRTWQPHASEERIEDAVRPLFVTADEIAYRQIALRIGPAVRVSAVKTFRRDVELGIGLEKIERAAYDGMVWRQRSAR